MNSQPEADQQTEMRLVMPGVIPTNQLAPNQRGMAMEVPLPLTHRGQSLQCCKPLIPGSCGLLEGFVPLDQFFHLINTLAYFTTREVGLLPQQPGLSHACVSGELVYLQNWAKEDRNQRHSCHKLHGKSSGIFCIYLNAAQGKSKCTWTSVVLN